MTDVQNTENAENAPVENADAAPDLSSFGIHAAAIQAMLAAVNATADTHNGLIARLAVKADGDNSEALEAIRKSNPQNDEKLKVLNARIAKIQAQLETYVADAYVIAEQYLPQPLEGEDKESVQTQVKNIQAQYKQMINGIKAFATSLGSSADEIGKHVTELNHLSGRKTGMDSGASGGTSGGAGSEIRIFSKEVWLNNNLVQVKKQGKENEMASNLSGAAGILTKTHKVKTTVADIVPVYFASANVTDKSQLPNDHTFTYVVKDSSGNEFPYEIRVVLS